MGRVDDPVAAALQPLPDAQQPQQEEEEDDDEVEEVVVKRSRPSSSSAATTGGETAAATEKDAAAAGQPPQPQAQQQRRLKRREETRKRKKRSQRVRVTLPLGAADDEVIPSMAELAARKGLAWTGAAGEGMAGGGKKAKQKRKCVVGILLWCVVCGV